MRFSKHPLAEATHSPFQSADEAVCLRTDEHSQWPELHPGSSAETLLSMLTCPECLSGLSETYPLAQLKALRDRWQSHDFPDPAIQPGANLIEALSRALDSWDRKEEA